MTRLTRTQARAEFAETELAKHQRHLHQVKRILENKSLPTGPKLTAIAAYFELDWQITQDAQPAPPLLKKDAPVAGGRPVVLARIAENSGQDTDTVGRHIKVLAAAGAWERGQVTVPVENGPPQTQVQLAPRPAFFDAPQTLTLPEGTPKHGGKREATPPACVNPQCAAPAEAIVHRVETVKVEYDICTECGVVQDLPLITGTRAAVELTTDGWEYHNRQVAGYTSAGTAPQDAARPAPDVLRPLDRSASTYTRGQISSPRAYAALMRGSPDL